VPVKLAAATPMTTAGKTAGKVGAMMMHTLVWVERGRGLGSRVYGLGFRV
jgi:hypothetical protein